MRDVIKTNVKREQNRKRKRRRRRHTMLYFFLVIFMVAGIGILLSVTLFFNVKKITVNGEVDYTRESIIMTSGIRDGDNLIRLDSEKVSETILSSMIYIETSNIDKQFPGTVVINVTRCVPTANIECGDGYLVVSARGKILEKVKDLSNGLPVVKGFEVTAKQPGQYLESKDEQKNGIVNEFLKTCSENEKNQVTDFDISDLYDLKVNYQNRITFKMGNSKDISYKLDLAGTVLEKVGKDQKGTMTMVGTNQISFRESISGVKTENDTNKTPVSDNENPTEKPDESAQQDEHPDNIWTQEPEYDYEQDDGGEYYGDGNSEETHYGNEDQYSDNGNYSDEYYGEYYEE